MGMKCLFSDLKGIAAWFVILSIPMASFLIIVFILYSSIYHWWARLITITYLIWFKHTFNFHKSGKTFKSKRLYKTLYPIINCAIEYIDATVVKDYEEDDLDSSRVSMMGCHPHGIFGAGILSSISFKDGGFCLHSDCDDAVAVLTLELQFMLPIWRELCYGYGFASVGASSIRKLLSAKKGIAVVLGGAREALHSQPGHMRLIVSERKGFFRIALQHGASIHPVITFGELDLYDQLHSLWLNRLQTKMLKFISFSLPLFWGRFGTIIPKRGNHIKTVVGRPIFVEKTENPTSDQIKDLQEIYKKSLFDIHARYNESLGKCTLSIL